MSHGMGAPLPINTDVEVIIRFPLSRGIAGHVAATGDARVDNMWHSVILSTMRR